MSPDQLQLLRRLVLNDASAISAVMTGSAWEFWSIDQKTVALVVIASLASVASEPGSLRWAFDEALAAGADDEQVFGAVLAIAPIIGVARLASALPALMGAADVEDLEG